MVGSSYSALPLLNRLKKRGFHVSVCGAQQSDPCHLYANHSYYVDYSDRDALRDLIGSQDFDFVVPSCNDYAYMSSAWCASLFGFPGYDKFEIAEILHTKHKFRDAISALNIPCPSVVFSENKNLVAPMTYPVLVKPVDSFSGRGVKKVYSERDFFPALDEARLESRSSDVIAETFIEGNLYSHSAFFKEGKIFLDFFVDEYCEVYPYQVDCSCHPSTLESKFRSLIQDYMELLAQRLGITDGLLHTQFIANRDGVYVIECMRRGPGDLYNSLIERSTGIDYLDYYIRPFINETYVEKIPDHEKFIVRHTISSDTESSVRGFTLDISAKSISYVSLKLSGEILRPAPFDKLGILFLEFDTFALMAQHCQTIGRSVRLD